MTKMTMGSGRQRLPEMQSAAIALCASAVWSGAHAAGPALPVPCVPGSCGPTGPSQFVTAGSATAVAAQNAMRINQTTNSAILNWASFNIGQGASVTFQQPSSSSITLNKIYQGSPSQIFGQLNANGQVYLLNQNGFLFGPTATVNVGSLLVSSLPLSLSDADFGKGILSPLQTNGSAVFDATKDPLVPGGRTFVVDSQGSPVLDSQGNRIPVQIVVQAGAQIQAASQGRVLLAGQNVTNGGSLSAPDGQVILAAGTKVYLQADADPNLRGLVVEVDQGGTAWNQLSGALSAPRGNITMAGLAVNQDGRISATTSVAANGSIRLEAADTATVTGTGADTHVASLHGGKLTIGPQSDMEILPELSSSATEVAAQAQLQSSVTLLGEQVFLKGGAIVAPGGNLTAIAAADPSTAAKDPNGGVAGADPNARLRIDSGVSIDLSGSRASLPVTANLVTAQLRSAELADDPTQRTGPLHGLTVYVDARTAQSMTVANVTGEIAAVPQTVAQRTEHGGNAVFQSDGDVVFSSGASLNVSGGSTSYTGGVMQTSYLVGANGKLYPIATANPLMSYVGVLNPTFSQAYNKWGVKDILPTPGLSTYQPGYVQGAAAGSVQFAARSMVLQGSLSGTAVNGLYQRTPATAVSGGQLIIGLPGGVGAITTPTIDFLAPAVQITRTPFPIVTSDDSSLPNPLTLNLPVSYVTDSGFTSTRIYSNYDVTLAAGPVLNLPSGSSLAIDAARVNVLSSITDPNGSLSFQNVASLGSANVAAGRPGVFIGSAVTLDTSGLWTNDMPIVGAGVSATAQTWQNGGSISLGVAAPGALLSVGNGVSLRANGGAWLNAKGSLVDGTGGSIALIDNAVNGGLDVGDQLSIQAFGAQGASGGTFSLAAPRVEISNGSGSWTKAQQVDDTLAPGGVFQVYSNLFSGYGFQKFNLNASGLVAADAADAKLLSVDPDTVINATVSTLYLQPGISLKPSAAALDGIATATLLPPYLRQAASLSLNALPPVTAKPDVQLGATVAGDVAIGKGASLTTDAGGSISLTSLDSVIVDGTLRAPGGNISMQIVSPSANQEAYQAFEVGFLPTQRIDLGPTGVLDVSGTFVSKPSMLPVDLGTLYAGGTVSLFADRGAVVAERGSLISVAGTSSPLDVLQANNTYGHEIASSAGGSITARSGESIFLLGDLNGAAGPMGTSGAAASGSLDVILTRSETWWGITGTLAIPTFNQGPLNVEIRPQQAVVVGVPTLLFNSNQLLLGAADLSKWGFDALRIESGNTFTMSGSFTLALNRSMVIESPVIAATSGAQASLSAPYLEVGYDLGSATPPNTNTVSPGTGSVRFSGGEVDLVGTTVFQGVSDVTFASSGDLLLRGVPSAAHLPAGAMTVAGNITLDAARIYPATATTFTIDAQDPAPGVSSTVTIGQTNPNPGTPLSAGGALSIVADAISSTGTIYAPFGTVSLNANATLTLGDGSFTSVSGNGLTIPYGQTQLGGLEWVYGGQAGPTVTGVPTRAVNLTAPAVTIAKQATIDLSGGGDLSAFEWVPGSGGTKDALASGVTPGLYAILPSTLGQAAPQDPQDFGNSGILAGESVYLSGGSGLAAGIYPLLPARYALVPGAYLIQIQPGMQSTVAGSLGALSDGTAVVAGFLTYGQTGLHQSPGYTGFALYPGTYGGQLAQYDLSQASTYFSSAATLAGNPRPTLPSDAGLLAIAVSSSLDVAGQVRTAAATGGLAAPIEISANDLVVGTASGPVPSDAVSIQGSVLTGWHPGSIVLGGTTSADGKTINVLANSVTIGSGTTLTADEIVLVASQSIAVQSGATLQTNSAANAVAPAAPPKEKPITLATTSGGGAGIVALSDLNWLIPSGQVSGSAVTVAVDAGASVASRGSLSIDAPGGVSLNGALVGPGAEWSLGSSSIGFVPAGTKADALSIGPGLLAQLATAGAVRLASTGAIDLLTPVTLGVDANGSPTLASLTISAESLNNQAGAGAGTTQFGAQKLTLEGANSNMSAGTAGPAGTSLSLVASELDIGPNDLAVNGFAATRAVVSGAVVGKGSGALSVDGDFSIAAAGVTAASAAQTDINATGALTIATANANSAKLPLQLGGALTLSGGTVDVAGTVTAPSGIVKIVSGGALNVDTGATIDTAGRVVSIGNQSVGTSGGSISIKSGGDLILSSGANLDVSGAGTGAGGTLSLSAGGSATVAATLTGKGGSGALGGSFVLDAGSLSPAVAAVNPMTSLATSIGSGGFNDAIDLRVRTGDVSLDAGSALSANEITVAADTGYVSIGGQIAANSGALRGSMSLFGGQGVELEAGGALHADGTGSSGLGGTIEIGTGQLVADQNGVLNAYNGASIRLDADSTITAAGAAGDGTLLLRAPALLASNGVAIQPIGSNTSGVGRIIIEPVLPFNTAAFSSSTTPTAADLQQVHDTVATYMSAAAPGFANLLAAGSQTPLFAEAGVELIAPGALTLQSGDLSSPALDLSSWRFTGTHNDVTPIDLTVRAGGDINVANTLTDGFADAVVGGKLQPTLLAGASSSIRLVSGADLSSANPLVALAGTGTLTIGTNTGTSAVVRTGTGDIDLIAGHNIVIGGPGSGAYTAGTPAIAPGGNDPNLYPNMPSPVGTAQGNGVAIPKTNLLMSFPTGGGNLVVRAGDNILGAALPSDSQSKTPPGVSSWQLREGHSTYTLSGKSQQTLPMWGVNLAAYDWNFGTLGGGDLRIAAGGDALNVTAASADSLLPQYGGGTAYVRSGGLSFTAGHDIGSAEVFLADGKGSVVAGGALTALLPVTGSDGSIVGHVGSAFYLQTSSLDVRSRLGMAVDGVFNPTTLGQISTAKALAGSYLSYDDDSSLSLQALAGDITLGNAEASGQTLLGIGVFNGIAGENRGVLPASLSVQALDGSIAFGGGIGNGGAIILAPSPHGQLNLLAAQDITGILDVTKVTMSDAVSGSYAAVGSPAGQIAVGAATFAGNIHSSDGTPALVTAGGNIDTLLLSIPKAAQVTAGEDIVDLTYTGENLNPTDQTVLMAGRDFVYSQAYGNHNGTSVGGPGQLDVLAGRSVSLGLSLGGITTTGNLFNPNLPTAKGADVTIATGLGTAPDFAGFLTSVIAPSATYQTALINYVESVEGSTGLSFASAEAAFQTLTPQQQRPLVDKVFFNELLLSGRAFNTVPGAGFKQGYAAIDALFPASRTGSAGAVSGSYAGNLTLAFSRIYTLSGGNIDLIVPGGSIDVGLANPPSSLNGRAASSLGIVAQGPGDVNIYSRGDVNVNASRIFTLGGGNILVWSDEGSIDAGRGAKTAVSAPPPAVLINADGTVTLDYSGAAAGSGIRTIQTDPKQTLGSVDLIAPVGTIDAGDAGIGAAGNINLASRAVVGLDNIQFGGTSAGVPAEVSNLGASLSGASNAGSSAANSATSSSEAAQRADQNAAAPLAQTALSWLDVFVTGLGEENCRTDDLECLKRQKTNLN
ncbi:MAG: hemagglutinin-related protein [Gammaproteobacteria bacterium]|nr:hemagglutinin-related protein [Gammaproteobacteria bacterium]